MRVDVGHKAVEEILLEPIHATANVGGASQLGRITVWQDDDHRTNLVLCHQVVHDVVDAADLEIDLLGVGGAADEVEDRITARLHVVRRRQTDDGVVVSANGFGVVMNVLDRAVRRVP